MLSRAGAWLALLGVLSACDPGYPSAEWGDAGYDHAALSDGFQLLGAHANAPCTACHASGDYHLRFRPADGNDCQACHAVAYETVHAAQGYPTTCTLCHTPTDWGAATFDHAALSGGFDLLAVHGSIPCSACHAAGTFQPLFDPADDGDCVTCHQATFPSPHLQRGYPTGCGLCHTPTAWANGLFDHPGVSGGFQLLGIHVGLRCTVCHAPGTFEPYPDPDDAGDCVACHQARYDQAHEGTGYPTKCVACHSPTFWGNGKFNHPGISGGFQLLGRHAALACTACHMAETLEPLFDPESAEDCVACHRADYDGHHEGTGFPLTCATCHSPAGWKREGFDHGSASGGFELVGAHAAANCVACHDVGSFAPLFLPADAQDCVACHRADYDGHHEGTGFPLTCASCHAPTDWSGGSFDHVSASGGFELLGVHGEIACAGCHAPEGFALLFDPADETDCLACHEAEYDAQHAGDGYPTTCQSCHTPTTWGAVDFDHDDDYFPIYSGRHAFPRWSSCATCHTDPDDFSEFTCFTCHVHNRNPMDNKHQGEVGYSYVPSACLGCHPDGTAD